MENRKRITNMLIASTLSIFFVAVFFAFRSSAETTALESGNTDESETIEMVGEYETDIASLQAQIENLRAQNAAYMEQNEELRAAVTTLQERESEYQVQIEQANQTITRLSGQNGSLAQGSIPFGDQPLGDQAIGDPGFGDQAFGDDVFGGAFPPPHRHSR